MNTPLYDFFTQDHRRLEAILENAIVDINNINLALYHEFRVGLLTHIKMEEKILFVAAQRANNGVPLPMAAQLRLEHGCITSFMVLTPNVSIIKILKHVLAIHDEVEEKNGGMYEACEALTTEQTDEILTQLKNTTLVPVHPFNDSDFALEVAKRSLTRAGYDYETILAS